MTAAQFEDAEGRALVEAIHQRKNRNTMNDTNPDEAAGFEWGVMSHTGQVHIEKDKNLAEISVAEFRIHGQPAYLVKRRVASSWDPAEESA